MRSLPPETFLCHTELSTASTAAIWGVHDSPCAAFQAVSSRLTHAQRHPNACVMYV